MTTPRRSKKGECIYCGETARLTRDHVPPRSIFGQWAPANLITVPSCHRCNAGASKDDEVFRLSFAIREDTKGNVERDDVFQTVKRSLRKPEAQRFSQTLQSRIRQVERITPTGLYLGHGWLYQGTGEPLERVAGRITKGLFYHIKGKRLPDDHAARAIHLSRLAELPTESQELYDEFITELLATQPARLGTAFAYWHIGSVFGSARTFWLLEIYGRLHFFCTTAPKNLPDPLSDPPPYIDNYGRACLSSRTEGEHKDRSPSTEIR